MSFLYCFTVWKDYIITLTVSLLHVRFDLIIAVISTRLLPDAAGGMTCFCSARLNPVRRGGIIVPVHSKKIYRQEAFFVEQKNTRALGALAVIITSICYGLVPSFSFLAFRMGVETETLLFNKFLYAAVIMWAYLLIRKINFRFSRRAVLGMVVTCAGYIGLSTTLYISFDYISGSLATIVSFTFPAMIVAIEMITRREPVSIVKIAAVLLSFGGLVLIVWSPDMKSDPVGIFFAFLAAVGYVVYLFGLDSKSVRQEDSFAIAGYVMTSAAAVNFVRCLASGKPLFVTEPAQIGMMILLSVVCVFFAILSYAIGVRLIGPGNAALINTMEPVLACIFGYFLVGDVLTPVMLIGSGLVVIAVLITNLPKKKPTKE